MDNVVHNGKFENGDEISTETESIWTLLVTRAELKIFVIQLKNKVLNPIEYELLLSKSNPRIQLYLV